MIGRLNSIDDKEIWFYGARDKDEQPNDTNKTVSSKAQVILFPQNFSINSGEVTKNSKLKC